MSFRPAAVAGALAATLAVVLSGCGDDGSAASDGKLSVVTSFYPLQYVTSRIAGDTTTITSLTPPGAEPHDLELAPKDVAKVSDAGLVVYLGGFQPSVDAAAQQSSADHRLDVAPAADLNRGAPAAEAGSGQADEGGKDPHFWLDPIRLTTVAGVIEKKLAEVSPDDAGTYAANLASLTGDLKSLDTDYRAGLATCANKDVVTSHEAFGYLAERYGLTQVGITGLSPEQEPDAATLAKVTRFVRTNDVRTIYYETLVSPAIARTVAAETGAATAVLDPIEGVTEASQGDDYLAIMRSDLKSLQKGQPCS